jgi:dTDP-glucose 4,6-dehydratase
MILDTIAEDRIETIVFDIKDKISVNDYLLKIRPDIIIHAAALKHVPILEKQPRDGFNTNVIGLLNIIDYLKFNANCRLCFISTDKAANPQSVLGKTKLIGEYLVAGLNLHDKDHGTIRVNNVVRFGNVFLSRGSVVETFVYQLSAGLPVTISNSNMRRFFMDVSEAARLICYSLGNKIEGISILKMGEPVMIIDIAKRIAKELGIDSFKTIEIGEKPGEKLSEDLFSEVEAGHINDLDYALNTDFSKYLELDSIPRHVMSDEEALTIIEDLLAHGNTFR